MNKPIDWYALYARLGWLCYYLATPLRWVVLSHTHRGYVWIEHDARVLLVQSWFGNGELSLPGGGIHGWERAADGVKREVKEEVGIALPHVDFLTEGFRRHRFGGKHFMLYGYRSPEPLICKRNKREIVDAQWVPIPDIPQLMRIAPEVLVAFEHRETEHEV